MDGNFGDRGQAAPQTVETAEAKGRIKPPLHPMRAYAELKPDPMTAARRAAEREMIFSSPLPHGAVKAFNRVMLVGFAGLAAFGVVLAFLNA